MKPSKIALAVAIIGATGFFIVREKIDELKLIFSKIKIFPTEFKNLNGKWNGGNPFITFDLDINFYNPTYQNFNANGVLLTIKQILFYDSNDNFLGTSPVNFKSLKIDAQTGTTIRNIPVKLELKATFETIAKLITTGKLPMAQPRIEVIVSLLGLEYKIG